ncbi:MAG: hypothetical protein RLN96_14070 [Pseudomonadales bacterium]
MRKFLFVSLSLLCIPSLQSCGSESSEPSSSSQTAFSNTNPTNPLGGIWVSEDDTASFLIAEDGRFMTQLLLDESLLGIGTGSGQIDISGSDEFSTEFSISGIVQIPGESDPPPTEEDLFSPRECTTAGTKNGEALFLTISCSVNGTQFEINPVLRQRLICPPGDECVNANKTYDVDSSIARIIGDFGVYNFNTQSLIVMEIDPFGIMNGRFQFSSWDCGMAGEINPIDPRYNLYDITFENVSCTDPFAFLEHTRWKGLMFVSAGKTEAQEIFLLARSQPREGEQVRNISYIFPRI